MRRELGAKVLPFAINEKQASKQLSSWASHLFSKGMWVGGAGSQSPFRLKKIYSPFWFYSAAVKADYVARVGHEHKSVKFHHPTNQYVDSKRISWRVYNAEHYSKHTADDAALQCYCSDQLWPKQTEVMKIDSEEGKGWRDFDSAFLTSNAELIEPIRFAPSSLWPSVLSHIESLENLKAIHELKAKFSADKVEIKSLEIKVLARSVRSVFLPGFLCEPNSFLNNDSTTPKNTKNTKIEKIEKIDELLKLFKNLKILEFFKNRKIIKTTPFASKFVLLSGSAPKKICGVKSFSSFKVWVTAMSVFSVASLVVSKFAFPLSNFSFFLFVFPPALFSAWLAKLIPHRTAITLHNEAVIHRNKLIYRQKELLGKKQLDDAEEFGYFSNLFSERAQSRNEDLKAQISTARKRLKSLDPKGYYRVLGLDIFAETKNISQKDIRLAFNAKAHEWHPDRAKGLRNDKGEMRRRNAKLKRIIKAYRVLRNKKTRRIYDHTAKKIKSK